MKAISHQRKAMQVTQCRISASMMCFRHTCTYMCPSHDATPPYDSEHQNEPVKATTSHCADEIWRIYTLLKGKKSDKMTFYLSTRRGQSTFTDRKDTRGGHFLFSARTQKAPVVILDRSLTWVILMCERKGPVLRPVTRACTVGVMQ